MNIYYCIVIFLFVSVSCKHKQRSDMQSVGWKQKKCVMVNIPEPIDFEENMLDSLRILKLEVSDSSLFGHISKLKIYKDRIYILDRRYANALFIFNKDGKFVKRIKNEGRGPGEFVSITNFEIAYTQNQLIIMDNYGYKFGFFDLEGNYLKETSSDIGIVSAAVLPEGYIVHAKSASDFWKKCKPFENDRIYYTTQDGKLLKSTFSYYDNADINFVIDRVLYTYPDGQITYAPRFRDTIYNLTYESITPRYAISFNNHSKIPLEILQNGSNKDIKSLVAGGKSCFLGEHMESDSYLYLEINFFNNLCGVFFHKKDGRCTTLQTANKELLTNPFITPLAITDDYFWTFFNSQEMKKYETLFKSSEINLSDDDNPVIVLYKMKSVKDRKGA